MPSPNLEPSNSQPDTVLYHFASAIPSWFDELMLDALLGDMGKGTEALQFLQTTPYIDGLKEHSDKFVMEPEHRAMSIERLQDTHIELYRLLLHHLVIHLVTQVSVQRINPPTVERVTADNQLTELMLLYEDELMEQLEEFFFTFMGANQLSELAQVLAEATKIPLLKKESQYQIQYYQSCVFNEQGAYEKAQTILQNLLVEPELDFLLSARVYTALGIASDYQGRFDEAINAHRRSSDIYLKLDDQIGQSKALKNIGIILHQLGKFDQTLSYFQDSYELAREAGAKEIEGRALNELGYAYKELGRWSEAIHCYQTAIEIWQQLADGESEGRAYNNLGEVYHLLGRWVEAESSYRQGLALALDPRQENKREASDMLLNLGLLFCMQERYAEAQTSYQRSLALAQELKNTIAQSQVFYRLGDLKERTGQHKEAKQDYLNAIHMIESMRERVQTEETRISIMGIRQHVYQAMVLLCVAEDNWTDALTYVERAKSRAFLDTLGQQSFTDILPSENPFTATQIQAQLPPDLLLVEYFTTGQAGPGETLLVNLPTESTHLRDFLAPPECLLAFVVTASHIWGYTLSGSVPQLKQEHFYRRDGRLRGTDPSPGQPLDRLRRWQKLHELLITPLQPQLAEARHIVFIPHSILHYLPLHALARQQLNQPPFHEAISISYAPSASVLLRAGTTESAAEPSNKRHPSLAIGVDRDGLVHAESEATWIAEQLQGQALIGDAATPETIYDALNSDAQSRFDVVHFACHGRFFPARPMDSSLVLSGGNLSAQTLVEEVRFNANIVTLSACDTGVSYLAYGDELLGLTRAFLKVGVQTVIVSLWSVHDIATRIFMERFYRAWQSDAHRAEALLQAQSDLQTMTIEAVKQWLDKNSYSPDAIDEQINVFATMLPGECPFNHPYYWAAFILVGDPF